MPDTIWIGRFDLVQHLEVVARQYQRDVIGDHTGGGDRKRLVVPISLPTKVPPGLAAAFVPRLINRGISICLYLHIFRS